MGSGLSPGSVSCLTGACSLAAVKSKGAKKKRKRGQDDSDEADEFSERDSELGERHSLAILALMSTLSCSDSFQCGLSVCVGVSMSAYFSHMPVCVIS